jgi:hypothetical protein
VKSPLRTPRNKRRQLASVYGTVDAAFELVVKRKHQSIRKGQNLSHKYGGDTLRRIDPVIGVEKSCPGQAPAAATVWARLQIDHVAEPPSQRDARKEIDVVRQRGIGRLENSGFDIADLILMWWTAPAPGIEVP